MQPEQSGYPTKFWDWFYFPHLDSWTIRWVVWFTILYVFPFIPYPANPWGYVVGKYLPGPAGIPQFMWLQYVLSALTVGSMMLFYRSCRIRGVFNQEGGSK